MRVLQISSEATPFAKTGGLADVAGALPNALEHEGCNCTLVLPAYREVLEKNLPIKKTKVLSTVPSSGINSKTASIMVKIAGIKICFFIG